MRRETSRRKAKEQSAAKREAQAELLLDGDDPTLNNPALDLEDSDVDDEWTPLKAGLEKTRLKKTSPVVFFFLIFSFLSFWGFLGFFKIYLPRRESL